MDAQADALSELLQVLACGEESASLTFRRIERSVLDDTARCGLAHIAGEELVHERLLRGLRAGLPAPVRDRELRLSLLRFFHDIAQHDIGLHLASIAALDSALCTILAALLASGRVLAGEPAVVAVFRHIQRDEAKHVRFSRQIAAELVPKDALCSAAERTRQSFVSLLAQRGAAFERLGLDAVTLFARLQHVPNQLFA